METLQKKYSGNQSVDLCKLIASLFVVFIHIPFPGEAGSMVTCLSRFAVPFFFAVSGYYSYNVSTRGLQKRIYHILKLNLIAILLHIAYRCLTAAYWGDSIMVVLNALVPNKEDLGMWVFLHVNPFGGHLWYLTAICVCYVILYTYVRFFSDKKVDYRPLYTVGFVLFIIRIAIMDILPLGGFQIPYYFYRDGFFIGLPVFCMGLFLRQYQQQILSSFCLTSRKLVAWLLIGILLSLFQWLTLSAGELPLGAVLQVLILILLLSSNPTVTSNGFLKERIIAKFRYLSTAVYIIHLDTNDFYSMFLQNRVYSALGHWEEWFRPFAVFLISIFISLAGYYVYQMLCFVRKKTGRRMI